LPLPALAKVDAAVAVAINKVVVVDAVADSLAVG
jgi:hypothetical protein